LGGGRKGAGTAGCAKWKVFRERGLAVEHAEHGKGRGALQNVRGTFGRVLMAERLRQIKRQVVEREEINRGIRNGGRKKMARSDEKVSRRRRGDPKKEQAAAPQHRETTTNLKWIAPQLKIGASSRCPTPREPLTEIKHKDMRLCGTHVIFSLFGVRFLSARPPERSGNRLAVAGYARDASGCRIAGYRG